MLNNKAPHTIFTLPVIVLIAILVSLVSVVVYSNLQSVFISSQGEIKQKLENLNNLLIPINAEIARDPNNSTAYSWRARIKEESGFPLEALPDYDKIIELNPGDSTSCLPRANARKALGMYPESVADYYHAIAYHPSYEYSYELPPGESFISYTNEGGRSGWVRE